MDKLDTEFKNANDSPGFLLWQISNKWQAQQRAALKPFGITHVQFVLLACLVYASGNINFTQKRLATHAQIDAMMTSQVLRKLEQKGLVKRHVSTTDGRAYTIKPTPAGVMLVNKAVKVVESVDKEFFDIKGIDLDILIKMMRRLT